MQKPAAPAARISPDRKAVAVVTIFLVVTIMLASYIFSFAAIAEVAELTGASNGIQYLAPVFIDGAILTYTLALALLRWRGDSIRRTIIALVSFTGISVAVNFAHSGAAQNWDFSRLETWFACLIGVSAPLAALFAAEEATRLVFTKEPESVDALEAPKPVTEDAPAVSVTPPVEEPETDPLPAPIAIAANEPQESESPALLEPVAPQPEPEVPAPDVEETPHLHPDSTRWHDPMLVSSFSESTP